MDFDFKAVLENFQAESEEGFQQLEESLLALEKAPGDREQVQRIFRVVHTIKGNASSLGMPLLSTHAHEVETILAPLRDATLAMTTELCSAFLKVIDDFKKELTAAIAESRKALADLEESPAPQSCQLFSGQEMENGTLGPAETTQPAPAQPQSQETLRVKLEKLDRMMDLAGEIAVLQSNLQRILQGIGEAGRESLEVHYELARLFGALQENLLQARMVSVQPLFQQFHRVVRDLASAGGKEACLVIEGGEVEVDTAIAGHLKDALLHMIRNAVDHGLEAPEVRAGNGKTPQGTITLRARHEAGTIHIEVSDDGAGLNREKITARARSKGLISPSQKLIDDEIFALVFAPGFSTADALTGVSGRGVGMDIVRRNIDALHGSIHIESRSGLGSTFHVRLPLTLTIMEGITVSTAGESYIVPLENVIECIQMPKASLHSNEGGVLSVRGEPLPYLRLRDVFHTPDASPPQRENVLIVSYGGGKAGIAVDELLGKGQAVIKPLGKIFARTTGLAGSTILGNGRVALILDVPALVREAHARRHNRPVANG
jgi:two-component system chemotaxis sensor kinase CheA